MKKIYILGFIACLLVACKPNLSTHPPFKGNADFSSYIAVGNSLTAGYADNSLYLTGQLNSYPLRLSEQFKFVGGGNFNQPLLNSDIGFPSPKLVLNTVTGCNGVASLSPIPFPGVDMVDNDNIAAQGPFNNLGVPGIRCYDYVVPGYAFIAKIGNAPYAYRFYDDPANETPMDMLNKTMAQLKPTFFTCWLGNNDVLLYATGGGQGSATQDIPSGFFQPGNITPTAVFQVDYDSVIKTLVKNGAKGALMNIPDVTSIPFCTTIPANGLTLRQGQADSLNAAYHAIGINTTFAAGANYFMITEHDGRTPRQATQGEYILLTTPQDSLTCAGWGSLKPIPAQYVLTADEVGNIQAATTAYNAIIQQAATTYGLAYVDMNSYLKTISTGISYSGVKYNAQFVTGGAFSLDGVHLTPRGYSIVANYIIQNINQKYSSTIPAIDINKYSGIKFP